MNFKSFNQHNDTFIGNKNRTELPNLPPGAYTLSYSPETDTMFFEKVKMNYDELIDLPSPEYEHVMKEVNTFLNADTKAKFSEYGFLYKRSFLLHGTHGTGKTCLVNRVGEKVIESGGIIIFNPNPQLLPKAFSVLEDIQPGRTTMVIFEEFDETLRHSEAELLSILDGEIQKDNIMYVATTNHYERIPARLKRPGRFASILEVKFPNLEARTVYLTQKLKKSSKDTIEAWAAATEGLSIDELKETVLSVMCLGNSLSDTVERMLVTKQDVLNNVNTKEANFDLENQESDMFSLSPLKQIYNPKKSRVR